MEQFGYNVRFEQYCNENRHSDEKWGEWYESYSNSLRSHILEKTKEYPSVTSIHDFQPGDTAYLVWAEWSTGDSFGHGDRTSVEAFALLKDAKDAFALQSALRMATQNHDAKNWEDQYKFYWKSSDGQVVENGFLPWLGYFESLDEVHVEAVLIGNYDA